MRKFGFIAFLVCVLHFIEDTILVTLGRYTEINFFLILIGTVIFGVLIAGIARIPIVKKWLGK